MKLSVVLTISAISYRFPGYLDAVQDFVTRFQIVVSKTSSQIVGCAYDFGDLNETASGFAPSENLQD